MDNNINDFSSEKTCMYKGRKYHVRDNGAIYRRSQDDGKIRKYDEEWTFGRFDQNTGYLLIGQERVHRIVCTAFHGEPIGDKNIVDHIDTNRCNNRPENLRWVTKLENALNNPITCAKIECRLGSIEAFKENPRLLDNYQSKNRNFEWMRTVTKEEAEHSFKHWDEWAKKPLTDRMPKGNGVGEWIFNNNLKKHYPLNNDSDFGNTWDNDWHNADYRSNYTKQMDIIKENNNHQYEQDYGLKDSLTPFAKQLDWKTPTEFPQTPQEISDTPLEDYLSRLPKGYFINKSIRLFFTEEGAKKYFTISLGKKWAGGDVFEDYC